MSDDVPMRDRDREFRIRVEESPVRRPDEGRFSVTIVGERGMSPMHRYVVGSALERSVVIDAVLALVRAELERRGGR